MKNRLDYLTNLIDKYLFGVDREASEAIKEVKDALLAMRIRLNEDDLEFARLHQVLVNQTAELATRLNELQQRANLSVDALPSCYDDSSYNAALDLNRKMQIQVQKLIDARDNQMLQEG